jgi:hypothetical protein
LVELLDRQPNDDEEVFVAEVDGNVIGGIGVSNRVHFTGTPASIDDLFVSADHEHLRWEEVLDTDALSASCDPDDSGITWIR